ncbi:hydrogenase [Lysobacter aestuarii]|uniref:Hydrogenase n=2 Tax=Marilutibacter aestuarii TaxID=1706195 RepID=A0A508A1F0_9GAMM|nr:hydrogenase [Lysobacter aestuarii]
MPSSLRCLALGLALATAACATTAARAPVQEKPMFAAERMTEHRAGDDLLTAGLGLAGLRDMAGPAFADPLNPSAAETRRRAIWSNWRGIADLAPGGGFGEVYGSTASVPGREYSALARVAGARQPHRVLVQVPDGFDADKRCVVVTAASGSRGVYGSIAVAGAWGLPRGCAVAYTDKGAGTDYYDLDSGQGVAADGRLATGGDLAFEPGLATFAGEGTRGVAVKHAHSGDNPEADWGRHVEQAARFALHALDQAFPASAPFTPDNTRVIAVGISNGGGAVLRAAELEGNWLDAVVAGEPNVDVEGGRSLYDYATEAALLMPCALLDPALGPLPQPPLAAQVGAVGLARCGALKAAGLVDGADAAAQAVDAHRRLNASGFSDEALRAGVLSSGFDLWRAVAVTYASAYGRYAPGAHPCGFSFAALDANGAPRPSTHAERAAWWSDGSGIPPGGGIGLVQAPVAAPDPGFDGLRCLRALWTGEGDDARRVHAGVDEIRASAPREGLPVVVVHGTDDGLIPPAFSSRPYVAMARAAGRDVRYWQVGHVQHFDAFLGLPDYAARYLPLLPYVYTALDRVDAYLDGTGPLPSNAVIATRPRGSGAALEAGHLVMPE